MTQSTTRQHIVEAADVMFYQRGFEHTSFADIAANVGISRGNFYHHFKSKDQILEAVIERRLDSTRRLLKQWERAGCTPEERIRSFIHILLVNKTPIKRYGCPVGTLVTELAKLEHVARADAGKVFTLFRKWLRRQFAELGREADADALAMHVLMRSQGVATLANAFRDEKFIRREVDQMCEWLRTCAEGESPCSS